MLAYLAEQRGETFLVGGRERLARKDQHIVLRDQPPDFRHLRRAQSAAVDALHGSRVCGERPGARADVTRCDSGVTAMWQRCVK